MEKVIYVGIFKKILGLEKSNKAVKLDLFKQVNTGTDLAFKKIRGLDKDNALFLNDLTQVLFSLDKAIGAINDIVVYEDARHHLKVDCVQKAEERTTRLRVKMRKLNDVIRLEASKPNPSNSYIAEALGGIDDLFNDVVMELKRFIGVFNDYTKRYELTRSIVTELNRIVLLKYR